MRWPRAGLVRPDPPPFRPGLPLTHRLRTSPNPRRSRRPDHHTPGVRGTGEGQPIARLRVLIRASPPVPHLAVLRVGHADIAQDHLIKARSALESRANLSRVPRYEYRVLQLRESMIGGKMSPDKLEHLLNDEARQGWQLKAITSTDVKGRVGPGGVEGLLVTFERPVG
jgi:hypothetical protein